MGDVLHVQTFDCLETLLDDLLHALFFESSLCFELSAQVPALAIFYYKMDVLVVEESLVEFGNIWMVNRQEDC